MTLPKPGERYTGRGFTFRIDDVRGGYVYFARWRTGGERENGVLSRVKYKYWREALPELKRRKKK